MNPSKSLMAFFVALVLLAAGPAFAVGDWIAVKAGKYTFYVLKDKFDAIKPAGPAEALYRAKDEKKKAQSTLSKSADGKLVINLWDNQAKKANPVPAELVVEQTNPKVPAATTKRAAPPAPKAQAPAKPASIQDDAIWAAVVGNDKVKPADREATALALQTFAKSHPDEYQRLSADKAKLAAAVAGAADLASKKSDGGAIDQFLLSAAPKAGSSSDAPSVTGKPVVDDKGDVVTVDDAVNRLIDLIPKDAALRKRIGDRFNEFVFDPSKRGDAGYVAQSVFDKDAETKTVDRLKAMAAKWVDAEGLVDGGKPVHPRKVAVLYFVLGDEQDLPNNLQTTFKVLKTLKASADRADLLPNLETRLKVFTNDAASKDNPGVDHPGQYSGQDDQGDQSALEAWWLGFYNDASSMAEDVLRASKVSKIDITKAVQQLDDASNPPGAGDKTGAVIGGGKRAKDIMSQGFDTDDLYVRGAYSGWIKSAGQEPGRHISIKLYTVREGGQLVDKVGVFDISEPGNASTPSNIYGKLFSMSKAGTSDVALDDRRTDGLHYSVTVDSRGGIKVLDGASKSSGLQCSISELYAARREQVMDGPRVEVNKQQFYLSFQGAPQGTYTYYRADADGNLIDSSGRPLGEKMRVSPANTAQVSQVGTTGFSQNLMTYQPLGNIGTDKSGKPVFYFLKWNDKLANFEYKTCDEAKKDQPGVRCELPTDDIVAPTPPPAADKGGGDKKPDGKKPDDKKPDGKKPDDGNGGNTDNGNTGNGSNGNGGLNGEDGTNTGSFSTNCDYTESSFKDKFKKIDQGDWKLFLNKQDVSNAFHACLNGDQTIFTQGIPAGASVIRSDDSNLIVEIVNASHFISPDDIQGGQIKGGDYTVKGGPPVNLTGRSIYYIDKKDLSHDGLKALAAEGGNTAYMDKVAWVRFGVDPKKPTDATDMEVHIRAANSGDIDADKVVALVTKAFALGNASKSTFNNDADRKKILDFIKSEVVKYKGKGTISTNPNVTIHLNVSREITEIKPVVPIVSLTTTGDDSGVKLRNGDPDVRVYTHENLVWCSYPNGTKPYGLETGEQHKAHMQPGK